jgi:hypothetical protein
MRTVVRAGVEPQDRRDRRLGGGRGQRSEKREKSQRVQEAREEPSALHESPLERQLSLF